MISIHLSDDSVVIHVRPKQSKKKKNNNIRTTPKQHTLLTG